jgi:ElaB/YqjD/DUF883 family membrane-anchored ribosome-binding protein
MTKSKDTKAGGDAETVDVQETVKKAKEVVNESVQAARERFRDVAGDVRERASRLSEDFRQGKDQASEAARERYAEFSENVRVGYHKARKDFDDLSTNVNEYVRDNPGRSVLIAAGVGFVVGLLLRGRRES